MTVTVKYDDIGRARLGSSDPYAEKYSGVVDASHQLLRNSESHVKFGHNYDLQMQDVIVAEREKILQSIITGIDKRATSTASSSPNLRNQNLSSSKNPSPLSASAPTSPSFALKVPKLGSSVPTKFETTPKSAPPTLIKKFYNLIKYVNVPDVLHGLENFGYLSSDQSIELFECMMQLKSECPELGKVMHYEEHERPFCTVKHVGVTCDSCLAADICGTRYKCAICPNYDMCENCERKGLLTHDITHPRIKMLVPSECTFEHACKSHNAQGEKTDTECPFINASKLPTSPTLPIATPTYKKRQLQFNTLLKKKQQRDSMRKLHIQEVERIRKETMREKEQKRAEEEREREKEKEKERERQRERELEGSSGGAEGKSILWGYFDNLKKQNKLQIVPDTNPDGSGPSSSGPNSSTPGPRSDTPIAISGHLEASTSSMTSSTAPVSLANSSSSNMSFSPPPVHISSSSSSLSSRLSNAPSSSSLTLSSPSSPSPVSSRAILNVPSSRVSSLQCGGISSSRLQDNKKFQPKSPECSPLFPSPALAQSIGSPIPKRASSLKQSMTIHKEDVDSDIEIVSAPKGGPKSRKLSVISKKEEVVAPKKATTAQTKSRRDLTDVLREMGLRLSSDSDQSDSDSESDLGYETSSPKRKNDMSFFSSLRDLLK
eukprot:Phypoly_transcript_04433.p1 GENE.Phypoly_transcript_04433~~Phypoly_transcript_04433.p1  ORF type:complete len:684 (+),score=167.35 Phypoly_transcript_04433:72-2054(+)